jgi:hypothetical protein
MYGNPWLRSMASSLSGNQLAVLLCRSHHKLRGQSLTKGEQFAVVAYRQGEQIGAGHWPMTQNMSPSDHAGLLQADIRGPERIFGRLARQFQALCHLSQWFGSPTKLSPGSSVVLK